METLWGRLEFDDSAGSMDLEDAPTITTIVRDGVFLPKFVKRKNICNSSFIEISNGAAKVSFLSGEFTAFVAVDPDGFVGRTDVGHMVGITE